MHRGPQANMIAAPTAAPAGFQPAPFHHAPNAALLIDFDNVTMGIRSDLGHELRNLLSSDIIKGKVAVQRAYADWRRYPQYIVPLAESSIDMIMAPAYGSSKKNATDIRLAVDAMELVFTRPEIGTYILLSGDSDFASLVTKLKEYGKYVIGVGIRESSSDLLVMNCDEYYSYNALAGLVKANEEETTKRDPWELVLEAVQRMKRNGDVMRSDRLKQVMQEIDSSFDEGNLGMAKFSRFCQEAAAKGLIKVSRLENGQMEVDVAEGAPALPARVSVVPSAERRAPSAESDRPRRGRRGGRGRARERDEHTTPRPAMADMAPELVPESAPELDFDSEVAIPEFRAPVAERRAPSAETEMSGPRLSKDEAFLLVRRAVEALAGSPEDTVSARRVRAMARDLLGRDSETLSERHFDRILRDMHDAEQIDLRKRGDDYEVSPSPDAPPIAAQLAASEAVATAAAHDASQAARSASGAASLRRGMRGRNRGRGDMPPELLTVGMVGAVENGAGASSVEADGEEPDAHDAAPVDGEAPKKRRRGVRGGRARKKKIEPGTE
jgi:uncharacterized protein (TIGR00288 family)